MPEQINPTFSVRRLLEYWGGVAQFQHTMEQYGWPVPYKTVQKWRERGSIPQTWLARMACVAKAQRRRFNLAEFVDAYPVSTRDETLRDFLGDVN